MSASGTRRVAQLAAVVLPLTCFFLLFHTQLLWRSSELLTNLSAAVITLDRLPRAVYNKSYPILDNENYYYEKSNIRPANRTPIIFYWTNLISRFSSFDDLPESYFSNDPALECPNTEKCLFTNSPKLMERADFVVFGFPEWIKTFNMPPATFKRPRNQLWIFFTNEAPCHTYHWDWLRSMNLDKKLVDFKDFFNLTMTYRLDSDIVASYGRFEKRANADLSRQYNRLANKTKTAIFMASYCGNRMSHRDEYIDALVNSGLDVEVIGKCDGKKSALAKQRVCARTDFWSTRDECSQLIGSTYKFYLAFENSLCKDYVTEKFFRAASIDAIPVVLNAANMSRIAPPHSYIDAKDFASPRDLAAFLRKVGSNERLYNSYFTWKPYYDVVQTMEGRTYKKNLCNLCLQAHKYLANPKPAVVKNIDKWWTHGGGCVEGSTSWNYDA